MAEVPNNQIIQEFANLITSIQSYKDEIEQMQTNNTKLNEDIQALEKEKKEGYKSFNTETHILVTIQELNEIKNDLLEAKDNAMYAYDEAQSAESSANEAINYADSSVDYASNGITSINKIIEEDE